MVNRLKYIIFFILITILLIFPTIIRNDYQIYLINRSFIHVIIACGLVFLTGFAGQISLGQAGFYAIGAYTSSILTTKLGVPVGIGILCGIILSVIAGFVLSIPSFKLKAFFLSLVTIAFGQIVWMLILNLENITGGPGGFFNVPFIKIFNINFTNKEYYYLLLLILIIIHYIIIRIRNSFIGLQMLAMNDDENAAESCGINVKKIKIFSFGFSAGLAGLAGGLYAHLAGFLTPEPFVFFESSNFVAMAVVGGLRSLWGGLIGGITLTFLPELFRLNIRGFENYYLIFSSTIVVLIVVFLPNGLGNKLSQIYDYFNKKFT